MDNYKIFNTVIFVLILVLVTVGGYYSYRCHKVAESIKITAPNGIESLEQITLGGVKQWIYIRGQDKAKPILLFLHGGPGKPDMAWSYAYQQSLESHFVVVRWDQRGAGKSYSLSLSPDTMTIKQSIADTLELTRYLLERFQQKKLFLLGHSWGSALGTLTVKQHPELFYAYIGTGQAADLAEQLKRTYQFDLQQAVTRNHKKALQQLKAIGPPPYPTADLFNNIKILHQWMLTFGGELYGAENYATVMQYAYFSPVYSLTDTLLRFPLGNMFSAKAMIAEVSAINLFKEAPQLEVPVIILQGRHDKNTDAEIAKNYFDQLIAPQKQWIWFEHSAHAPVYEESEKFQATLIEKLPPLVSPQE